MTDEKTKAVTGDADGITSKEEAVKGVQDKDFQAKDNPNAGRVISRPAPKTTPVVDRTGDKQSPSASAMTDDEVAKARLASGGGATTEVSNQTKISDKQAARNAEKSDLLKRITKIEEEFQHNIGDIPRDHEYWDLLNAYRRK